MNSRLLVTCAFYALSVPVPLARAQSEESLRAQRHEALRTILAGKPMRAASELLAVIREVPTDKPFWADVALGNLQLLEFDVNYLMNDRMRQEFFDRSLDADTYETDAFLRTLHWASVKKTNTEYQDFLSQLDKHSRSSNQFIAVIALYYLANPYFTANLPEGAEASNRMATLYPTLKATRNMLELPIYHWRERRDVASEWVRAYLGDPVAPGHVRIREATSAEQRIARTIPFVKKMPPVFFAFEGTSIKREGVDALCALIADETADWRDRYGYLRMLEPEMKPPRVGEIAQGYWKLIRPVVEALANREELTPDVYRARTLMCRVACGAGDFESAEHWAERVLAEQERLFEHPERILYEEAVNTYRGHAEALANERQFDRAVKAYKRLGAFYPNSAVAMDCRKQAAAARRRAK
ncbi:MAG: hypothetical protein IT364_27300 [Candidatus Hydrogenedentes bacterium]|nr:hypothetical protein [Candidatus Hydrogenedentota bacterium]